MSAAWNAPSIASARLFSEPLVLCYHGTPKILETLIIASPVAPETYGDLLESAFDVHRNKLYDAARWAKPANAAAELQAGRELTEYLLRGSDSPALIFSDPARS